MTETIHLNLVKLEDEKPYSIYKDGNLICSYSTEQDAAKFMHNFIQKITQENKVANVALVSAQYRIELDND